LFRADLPHDVEKPLVGIPFQVQFKIRPPRCHNAGDGGDVAATDMPLVRTRMQRDAPCARITRHANEGKKIRHPGSAGVSEQGDLVQIHA